MHNEKFLKAKMKSYHGKMSTNFHDNGMSKEGPDQVSLLVIFIDSIFKICKNCYP